MNGRFLRSMVAVAAVLGLTTVMHPNLGMVVSILGGVYLATRLWFADHPATRWYDLMFVLAVLGTALVAGAVYAVGCGLLAVTGITTYSCVTLGIQNAFFLHLWVLGLVGGLFWLVFHIWMWRGRGDA